MKTLTQTKLTGNPEIDKYLVQNYNLLDEVNNQGYFYEHILRQFNMNFEDFNRFIENEYPYNYKDVINKHYDTYIGEYSEDDLYNEIYWFTHELISCGTWLPQIVNYIRNYYRFFNIEDKIQLSRAVKIHTNDPELLDALSYYLKLTKEED